MSRLPEDRIHALVACFPRGDAAQNQFRQNLTVGLQAIGGKQEDPPTSLAEALERAIRVVQSNVAPTFEPKFDVPLLAQWCRRADERASAFAVTEPLGPAAPPPLEVERQQAARAEATAARELRSRFL